MKSLAPALLLASLSCTPPAGPTPPLGKVVPQAVFYEPGNGTMTAVIQFSDDVRDDCTASDQQMNYGHQALLSMFSSTDFAKGEVMPWVPRSQSTTVMPPAAFFGLDDLSGLDLTAATGQLTVVHAPGDGDKNFELHLQSPDAGVDATFVVPALCP